MPDAEGKQIIGFGVFRLELGTYVLRKNGTRIRLALQPTRVLALLAAQQGELVSREELKDAIWGSEPPADFDHGLNSCIQQIRAVLNDDAEKPRFIETLPKRGYRFVAPVTPIEIEIKTQAVPASESGAKKEEAEERTQKTAVRKRSYPWVALGMALGGVAIAAIAVALLLPKATPTVRRVAQLTQFGRAEYWSWLVTDGPRLFFMVRTGGHWQIAHVPVRGGEPTFVETPFHNTMLFDISPDGGELLVGEWEADEHEMQLWALPSLGGSPRQIGDIKAAAAAWFPDGKRLLFVRGHEIFSADVEGSNARKIAQVEGEADFFRWSPDGTLVRFMQERKPTGYLTLWEMQADGSHLRTVLPQGDAPISGWWSGDCSGGWTPDGNYYFYRDRAGLFAREERGLLPFTRRSTHIYDPQSGYCAVLPGRDGRHLYFIGDQETRHLVRYDQATQQWQPFLAGIAAHRATVSPDGEWLAYISWTDSALWRCRIDGSERRRLTAASFQVERASWSPDGRQILIVPAGETHGHNIFLMNRDEDRPRQLTFGNFFDLNPSWTPDSSAIYFKRSTGADEKGTWFRLEVSSGRMTPLATDAGESRPNWSPDRKWAAATGDAERPGNLQPISLFDVQKNQWQRVTTAAFPVNGTWSRDSRYYFYQDLFGGAAAPVYRIRAKDGRVERVTSASFVPPGDVAAYVFTGVDPDNAPLGYEIRKNGDIYALDLEFR